MKTLGLEVFVLKAIRSNGAVFFVEQTMVMLFCMGGPARAGNSGFDVFGNEVTDDRTFRAGKVNSVAGLPGNPAVITWGRTAEGLKNKDVEAVNTPLGKNNLAAIPAMPVLAADTAWGN